MAWRGGVMKVLELKPEELPMLVQLRSPEGSKRYVLVKTKQGKLLLNKPMDSVQNSK
jgi:hypothetical protein